MLRIGITNRPTIRSEMANEKIRILLGVRNDLSNSTEQITRRLPKIVVSIRARRIGVIIRFFAVSRSEKSVSVMAEVFSDSFISSEAIVIFNWGSFW